MEHLAKIVFLPFILTYSCSVYSQTTPFVITNEFEVSIDYPFHLAYDNNTIWLIDGQFSKIYKLDTSGNFIDTIECDFQICGIDVLVDTLFLLKKGEQEDSIGTIYKLNHRTREICDSISWSIDKYVDEFKLLAVNERFFFVYYSAGWSSRIVQFKLTGEKLNYFLAPGFGMPAGLTCYQDTIWYMTTQGTEQYGRIWKRVVENEMIVHGDPSSLEIPLFEPCGIAYINFMCFYVGSISDDKIYKIERHDITSRISIKYNQVNEIHIYPNPTTGGIKLDTQLNVERLEIYSLKGELLYNSPLETTDIQLHSIGKGCYILRIYTTNSVISKKLIIN